MQLAKEIIITALFLSIYIPLSIALWYFTGQTTNLVLVMLIGLSIITAYIYIQLARYKLRWRFRRFFRRRKRTYITIDDEPEEKIEPEQEQDYDLENLEGFRSLFQTVPSDRKLSTVCNPCNSDELQLFSHNKDLRSLNFPTERDKHGGEAIS